jgi:hypothetical protein
VYELLLSLYILFPVSSLLFLIFVDGGIGQHLQIEGPPGTQLVAVHVCHVRVSWLLVLRA